MEPKLAVLLDTLPKADVTWLIMESGPGNHRAQKLASGHRRHTKALPRGTRHRLLLSCVSCSCKVKNAFPLFPANSLNTPSSPHDKPSLTSVMLIQKATNFINWSPPLTSPC